MSAAAKRDLHGIELDGEPVPGCHLCRGRGIRKSWGTPYKFGACPRCFPDHPQRAREFGHKEHVRAPGGIG